MVIRVIADNWNDEEKVFSMALKLSLVLPHFYDIIAATWKKKKIVDHCLHLITKIVFIKSGKWLWGLCVLEGGMIWLGHNIPSSESIVHTFM